MPIAAVPAYLQKDDPEFYLSAPPGHRFLLYLPVWGENQETNNIDWRMSDRVPKFKRQREQLIQQGWEDLPNDQYACTIAACKTPAFDELRPRKRKPNQDRGLEPWRKLMAALYSRQLAMPVGISKEKLFSAQATAIAPFTTGLGNEHPLENGFAFLWPYGLPYLPGSGVKGVLRRAAQELAQGLWEDARGWQDLDQTVYEIETGSGKNKRCIALSVLDVLFGREPPSGDSDAVRGALAFWDVIPEIKGDSLMVEIMTPHQSHYYQNIQEARSGNSNTPHDSGQPNPIAFLTVPPGSRFSFCVVCDTPHLARLTANRKMGAPDLLEMIDGRPRWQVLLQAAFEHAFTWLGFGAKTAVGYGSMETAAREKQEQPQRASEQAAQPQQAEPEATAQAETWSGARIRFNRNNGTLTVEKGGKSAHAYAPQGKALLDRLPPEIRQKIESNMFVKVTARVTGSKLLEISTS